MTQAWACRSMAVLSLWVASHPLPALAEDADPGSAMLNPLQGLAKDALAGFRDRPLFNPARAEPRAPETAPLPAAPPPEAPAEPPPAIRLVGIVSGPQTLAVVRPSEGGKTSLLATGDKLGAWTATVSADALTLQNAARTVSFGLFQRRGGAGAGQPATTGGPYVAKGADAFPPTGDPPP